MIIINRLRRQKKQGKVNISGEPLLKKITVQHTETTYKNQNADTPDQSGVFSDQISSESEVSEEEVLGILQKILSTNTDPEDIENATVKIKKWGEQNGVTMDQKEGSYSQDWLREFKQLIDESVEIHFPILPQNETQTSLQLEQFENIICSEVRRLAHILKDAGLLGYLIQSYSRQLFTKLDLILHKDLSVDETFCLLLWGNHVFFSPDYKNAFNVHDPLLLTGWFERVKHKLLTVLKHEISIYLQNILCNEEKPEDQEISMNEEWFIRVHIDVTQCLSASIQNSKKVSLTLMNSVQILCLEELRCFAQMYANGENQRLENLQSLDTNFVYLCRIISTCMKLRCFAVQISNQDKNESADILKVLEDQILSRVQKMVKDLAQVSIKSFQNESEHINNLTEKIRKLCAPLSQIKAAEEIKTIFMNLVYDCVCRVYLDCLIKTDFKGWDNVEERIRHHIRIIQDEFAQMNCSVEQNQLLGKMSEVLFCNDVEALKLTCAILFNDFPEESEHYLHGLLRWKKTLSKRQVREVLDAAQNPARAQPSSTAMSIDCFHCCLCWKQQ